MSLRDIKRVVKIVKWTLGYMKLLSKELGFKAKSVIILGVLVAVNLCYGLRLNGITGKN